MASPQKENGYTPIANELLDAFMRLNLSEHAWRIVICIIRHSYGWHQKTAYLTFTQIARATGLDVRLIPRTIKRLCGRGIIVRDKNAYGLQKDYSKWRVSSAEMSSVVMNPSSVGMTSVEMKSFIRSDEEPSSVVMKPRALLPNKNAELSTPKERKESIKEISLSNDGQDINLEMVRRGYAWAYKQYLRRPYASAYIEAEREARGKRLGLWRDDNPTPPWEFRHKKKHRFL